MFCKCQVREVIESRMKADIGEQLDIQTCEESKRERGGRERESESVCVCVCELC